MTMQVSSVKVVLISGPAVAMNLKYASQCAGIGEDEHDSECPRDLARGARALWQRPNVYSFQCADHLTSPKWSGSPVNGQYVYAFTGRGAA